MRSYDQRAHYRETQATTRRAGTMARLILPLLVLFWGIVIAAVVH